MNISHGTRPLSSRGLFEQRRLRSRLFIAAAHGGMARIIGRVLDRPLQQTWGLARYRANRALRDLGKLILNMTVQLDKSCQTPDSPQRWDENGPNSCQTFDSLQDFPGADTPKFKTDTRRVLRIIRSFRPFWTEKHNSKIPNAASPTHSEA